MTSETPREQECSGHVEVEWEVDIEGRKAVFHGDRSLETFAVMSRAVPEKWRDIDIVGWREA